MNFKAPGQLLVGIMLMLFCCVLAGEVPISENQSHLLHTDHPGFPTSPAANALDYVIGPGASRVTDAPKVFLDLNDVKNALMLVDRRDNAGVGEAPSLSESMDFDN
ncbi:MAG: hypothetical protein ABW147_17925, partial [Candidatus Thiodiazotropha sp.]